MATKVLYIVESTAGGALTVIKESIKQLELHHPKKFQFTIVYSKRVDTPKNLKDHLINSKLIHIQMGSRAIEISDIKNILKLRKIMQDFNVVHMHSSRAGFLGRIALISILKKPKSFYSPHGLGFINVEFRLMKKKIIWLVEYLLAKFTKTVIIACGPTEFKLAQSITTRTIMIPNGFSVDEMKFKKKEVRSDGSINVVCSGRNVIQKDPNFFIKIYQQNNNPKIKFKWVGDIKSEIATGWLTRDSALKELNQADIYLATSLCEGLPINGIEALCLGKPMIVRNTSSYVDLVVHGVNGYIFSNIDEALCYLDELSNDRDKIRSMSIKSRELAHKKYHVSNYLQLSNLYLQG